MESAIQTVAVGLGVEVGRGTRIGRDGPGNGPLGPGGVGSSHEARLSSGRFRDFLPPGRSALTMWYVIWYNTLP